MIDQNGFGKRQWVKLWVGEWLDGTTRYEMTGAQRALWIDLLAMAGRSRQPGIICAGWSGDRIIGYPLTHFQALDAGGELDIPATLHLFEACGKIRMEVTQETPIKLLKIEIVNWGKYQSNLAGQAERARKYRQNKQKSDDTSRDSSRDASCDASRPRHAEISRSVTGVEVEVEVEVDKNICANPSGSHESFSLQTPKPPDEKLLAVERVWAYYIEKLGKNPKVLTFTAGRKQKGMARLAECLAKTGGDLVKAEGLMRVAVDALAASAYHRGENDRKTKYESWEDNLFKNPEQLEKWLERT